jgi:hypothetical protein
MDAAVSRTSGWRDFTVETQRAWTIHRPVFFSSSIQGSKTVEIAYFPGFGV